MQITKKLFKGNHGNNKKLLEDKLKEMIDKSETQQN